MNASTALMGCIGAMIGCIACLGFLCLFQQIRQTNLKELNDILWHRVDRLEEELLEATRTPEEPQK